MGNITTFTQLNLAYNDPTQEGLSFSTNVTQSYATHQTFALQKTFSPEFLLATEPTAYFTITPVDNFESIGVHIKGSAYGATQVSKAIAFEQIYCWDSLNQTQTFIYSYISHPTGNTTAPTPPQEFLYNYTITDNYIEYDTSTNIYTCYLAIRVPSTTSTIKGTYLLI